jgi:hypothetical protein
MASSDAAHKKGDHGKSDETVHGPSQS